MVLIGSQRNTKASLLLWLACLLGCMVWPDSKAIADTVTTIVFFSDDLEHRLQMPSPNCIPLLDDPSNYSIQTGSNGSLLIKTLALNDRSAMLIVDCPTGSSYYDLRFFPRRKYASVNFENQIPKRPDSYVGTRINLGASGTGLTFETADRTFRPLQIAAQRNYSQQNKNLLVSDSLDFAHQHDLYRIGYGATETKAKDGESQTLRANAAAGSASITASETTYRFIDNKESSIWVHTPSPIGISYGEEISRDKEKKRIITRFFASNYKQIIMTALTKVEEIRKESEPLSRFGTIDMTEYFSENSWLRPDNTTSIRCERLGTCKLTKWFIRTLFNHENHSALVEYGLLPHYASFDYTLRLRGMNAWNIQARHYFKPGTFVNHQHWATAINGSTASNLSTNIHIEQRRNQ